MLGGTLRCRCAVGMVAVILWTSIAAGHAAAANLFAPSWDDEYSSWQQRTADGRHVLVMVAPLTLERDVRTAIDERQVREIRAKYQQSGLYKNDGSTNPLWTIEYFGYSPNGTVHIASDAHHLVVAGCQLRSFRRYECYPEVTFFADGKPLAEVILHQVMTFPASKEFVSGKHCEVRKVQFDAVKHTYSFRTDLGEEFVIEFVTGKETYRWSPWPIAMTLLVSLLLLVIGFATLSKRRRQSTFWLSIGFCCGWLLAIVASIMAIDATEGLSLLAFVMLLVSQTALIAIWAVLGTTYEAVRMFTALGWMIGLCALAGHLYLEGVPFRVHPSLHWQTEVWPFAVGMVAISLVLFVFRAIGYHWEKIAPHSQAIPENRRRRWPRFSLQQLLVWSLVIFVGFGTLRWFPWNENYMSLHDVIWAATSGISGALVSLLLVWAVLGNGNPWKRLGLVLLITVALYPLLVVCDSYVGPTWIDAGFMLSISTRNMMLLVMCVPTMGALFLAGSLGVYRARGFRLVRVKA